MLRQSLFAVVAVLLLRCSAATPTSANCTAHQFMQQVDHFNFNSPALGVTFAQRYFTYSKYWKGPGAPIFFYTGNEGDVTLYVNHTGLMWENAEEVSTHSEGIFFSVTAGVPGCQIGQTGPVVLCSVCFHAWQFGALLIFAEHRYYGESLPYGSESTSHLQ